MNDLSITSTIKGSLCVLALSGKLDSGTTGILEEELRTQIDAGNGRLILNCKQLEYISSAGMGVLLKFMQPARAIGGDIKISNLPKKIDKIFRAIGMYATFDLFDFEEEAAIAFESE